MKYICFFITCFGICFSAYAQPLLNMNETSSDSAENKLVSIDSADFVSTSNTDSNNLTTTASTQQLTNQYPEFINHAVEAFNKTHQPFAFQYKNDIIKKDSAIKKGRIWLIGGSTLGLLGYSFYYANNAWWSGQKATFHFDGGKGIKHLFDFGRDASYALGLDKLGHFYGGVIMSELFKSSLKGAGLSETKANLLSAAFSSSVQLFIEVKDGYAQNWGFSVYDFLAGSIGSLYPYFQSKSKFLSAVDVKFGYYKYDNYYFKIRDRDHGDPSWHDDYMNQTYWFSYSRGRHKPDSKWPKWLSVAVGFGIDNRLNSYYLGKYLLGAGGHEFYIAPDIDFRGLLPKKPIWQKVAKVLNLVKVPLPALRFSRDTRLLPLFL